MEFALPPGKLAGDNPPPLLPAARETVMVTNENRETYVKYVQRCIVGASIESRIAAVRRGLP